jgi:pyruvate dehydrogenase E2 component (dihydrolipoamide acetyltransferase)
VSNFNVVRMPKWGLSMEEGTVGVWLKKAGEYVAEGDELVEIETTKITNVLEATQSGTLARIVAEPGSVLGVGQPIAVLANGDAPEADLDAFLATLASAPLELQEDDGPQEMSLSMIDVNGRSIQIGRAGRGAPPVILIHGFSGDLQSWGLSMEALARSHEVIALDLPGHGASEKEVGDGSLSTLASVVAGTLDALEVERAHIVGHSLGAAVAQQLSLDRPDLVLSLTLICPPGMPGNLVSREFLDSIVNAQRARDIRSALTHLVADPAMIGAEMVERMQRYKRIDGVQGSLATLRDRLLAADDTNQLNSALERMPPAFVIVSKGDRIVGAPDQSLLPKGWRVEWIDGVGHMPHIEKATETNALILQNIANS